jgi:hypothetical protein
MRRALQSPEFESAAGDYLRLLDRGYPERRSRELVAGRYRLELPIQRAQIVSVDFLNLLLLINSEPKIRLPTVVENGDLLQLLHGELAPFSEEFFLCLFYPKPDRELIGLGEGLICSSDTRVLDKTTQRTVDIGGYILRRRYGDKLTDIRRIIEAEPPPNR